METIFFVKLGATALVVFLLGVVTVFFNIVQQRSKSTYDKRYDTPWYALPVIVAVYGGGATVVFSIFGIIWTL